MVQTSEQKIKKKARNWVGVFFTYAAGPLLVAYILLLLGMSYISQQNLRQANSKTLLFNLEKKASALSYFHSERISDIHTLSNDRALSVFFSNRDLGMSMEYGLKASLISMKKKFQDMLSSKKINSTSIYLRLVFIENQGNLLLDVGATSEPNAPWIYNPVVSNKEVGTVIIQNSKHSHLVIFYPFHYKGQKMGTILAEINYAQVIRHLIHPQASELSQYTLLMDSRYAINSEPTEMPRAELSNLLLGPIQDQSDAEFLSFNTMPVAGTPFVLAAKFNEEILTGFITSPWYLIAQIILAILVLTAVVIGIRVRMHNLLLHRNYEESERQSRLLNGQNRLLEEEVRKRLNSEARLQTLIETIPDLVWLKNPEGIYLACNRKFERLYGTKECDIVGKSDYDFVKKEIADSFREYDNAAIIAGKPSINEETVTYADDGHKELLETIKTPLHDSDGQLVGILGIARDITLRKQAEEEFIYLSVHDPLTGLYNRRVLEQRITDEVNRANRYKRDLSVFMIDLDRFKQINDTYGHKNGDIILCAISEILESSIRKTDYAARYGGEEFIIVLPDTSLSKSYELAERLCHKIAEQSIRIEGGKKLNITASIGIATFPEHGKSWSDLVEAADQAMYVAKKAGRNRVQKAEILFKIQKS